MTATLRSLLAEPQFHLRIVSGVDPGTGVLDQPIAWVHNSELSDPTPWLEPDQLLLIDGLQFVDHPQPSWAEDYVRRLQSCRVLALGFATSVAHDVVPQQLAEACAKLGFPLLEVGDRAPFISIIRYVADAIAAEQRRRMEWSLTAQRAVARAALRPDGLDAVLRELEIQLGTWVALYDPAGNRIEVETTIGAPEESLEVIAQAVLSTLQHGSPANRMLELGDTDATLQTLGPRGRLYGALVVGTHAPLDAAESDLVRSVIGLASIALEQSRALGAARLHLRSGVLELLLSGRIDVASRTAERAWGRLPHAPIRVVVLTAGDAPQTFLRDLEMLADRQNGRLFFAERDDEIVAIANERNTPPITGVALHHGRLAGVSAPVPWTELGRGLQEARRAAQNATPSRPIVDFEAVVDEGIIAFLDAAGVQPVAERRLRAVLESENPDHSPLLNTLAVWLEHNGAWDPAARELNIHRHTLRNRLQTLERLLAVDLGRFSSRAELWAALQFVDYPGKRRS